GGPQAPLVYDLTAGHDQRHLLVRSRGDGGTRGVRGRDRAELPAAGRGARLRRIAGRAHVADDDLAAQLPVGAARCLPVGGDPAPPRPAGGTVRSGPSRSGWPGRRQVLLAGQCVHHWSDACETVKLPIPRAAQESAPFSGGKAEDWAGGILAVPNADLAALQARDFDAVAVRET